MYMYMCMYMYMHSVCTKMYIVSANVFHLVDEH